MRSRRRLPIWFKNSITIGFGNSRPRIRYGKPHFVVGECRSDDDGAAFRRELDSVIDQIGQNLKETIAVHDHYGISFNLAVDRYRLTASLDAREFTSFLSQVLRGVLFRVQRQFSMPFDDR